MIRYIKAIKIEISKPTSSSARGPFENDNHYSCKLIFISGITMSIYSMAVEYEYVWGLIRTVSSSVLIKTNWFDVRLINNTNIMDTSMSLHSLYLPSPISHLTLPWVQRMFGRVSPVSFFGPLFNLSLRDFYFVDINFYVHEEHIAHRSGVGWHFFFYLIDIAPHKYG